jgi:RNA polymerase sigma-70 factor (ECF subfamily)
MNNLMDDFSDDRLAHDAKMGSREAFSELALRYRERIYHIIFRFTRNPGDADDLAQETFMMAYKSLKHFEQKSSFYTWIYRIAINLTLNFLKKRKKEQGRGDYIEGYAYTEAPRSPLFSPETHSERKELGERMDEAIRSLPTAYQAAFVLVSFQGMTHAQAGRVLGCSENTVSWRMHKARKMLQAKLRPFLSEVRP